MGLGKIQQGLIRAVFSENIAAGNIRAAVIGVILGADLPKVQIRPDAFTERLDPGFHKANAQYPVGSNFGNENMILGRSPMAITSSRPFTDSASTRLEYEALLTDQRVDDLRDAVQLLADRDHSRLRASNNVQY